MVINKIHIIIIMNRELGILKKTHCLLLYPQEDPNRATPHTMHDTIIIRLHSIQNKFNGSINTCVLLNL